MWKPFALALKSQSEDGGEDTNVCNTTATAFESHDLNLRVVSIFVLLVASLVGASFALISHRVKCLRVNPIIINTGKFFGTG